MAKLTREEIKHASEMLREAKNITPEAQQIVWYCQWAMKYGENLCQTASSALKQLSKEE